MWTVNKTGEGAKLTGDKLNVFCRVFHFKLGSFVPLYTKWNLLMQPLLELETRPRFSPPY